MLQFALDWWQAQGFAFVDLPWMVQAAFSDATRPSFCRDIPTLHGSFVASGEQSFLQLWDQGELPAGVPGYVGWTPCLRDEAVLDATHQHGFMKAEWFVPLEGALAEDWRPRLEDLVQRQLALFQALGPHLGAAGPNLVVQREETGAASLDLTLGGLEVGSYGARTFNCRTYLYGTALALPRFTQAAQASRVTQGGGLT